LWLHFLLQFGGAGILICAGSTPAIFGIAFTGFVFVWMDQLP
jgi:hypothetical protein